MLVILAPPSGAADTLARAIRDGLDPQGRPLSYLMPSFALDDADMAALTQYLKPTASTPCRAAIG